MSTDEQKPSQPAKPKLRALHRTTAAYRSEHEGHGFSDISEGYYLSAVMLHELGRDEATKVPANTSKYIPPSIVLYCCALDAYLNSILGRTQLITDRQELVQRSYEVATGSLGAEKMRDFVWILQLQNLVDEATIDKISILANLRGEVVHFVPVPNRQSEWRGRVLEAVRKAGVPPDQFQMLDSQAAMCRVELADWSRGLVDHVTAVIQNHFGWQPAFRAAD